MTNPAVDFYFEKESKWKNEIAEMRQIALECNLVETLKWGVPCYQFEGKNIVLIHIFKNYCAFLFFKGSLMKDPEAILIQQTENVQAARQVRFTNVDQVIDQKAILQQYIYEAAAITESGEKVAMKETKEFPIPEELLEKFTENSGLKTAFEALTPGCQRAYLLHFAQPKQSKTRESRIEKNIPKILEGKGLLD